MDGRDNLSGTIAMKVSVLRVSRCVVEPGGPGCRVFDEQCSSCVVCKLSSAHTMIPVWEISKMLVG